MLKIVSFALVSAIIVIYLKNINSQLTVLVEIMSGIIVLYLSLSYVDEAVGFMDKLIELTTIDKSIFKIVFKVTAIGCLVGFAANTIEDFGLKGLSDKVEFAGKVVILCTSFPVVYALFNLFIGLMQ